MKLPAKIIPKNLFNSSNKKRNTVSRSHSSSFNSSVTTSSTSPDSSHHRNSKSDGVTTPTSVLPTLHTSSVDSQLQLLKSKSNGVSVLPTLDTITSSVDSQFELLKSKSSRVSVLPTLGTSSDVQFESVNSKSKGVTTPTSVLRLPTVDTFSDELSDISVDLQSELLQAFQIIDTDGDGRITRSELEALLSRIGGSGSGSEPVTAEEVSLMINELDVDGDGSISLQEFGVISSAFGPVSCDDEIRGAFEFFDRDGDGMITAEELFAVFESIGGGGGGVTLEDCRRMIRSVDRNGDGFVCFEDFRRMMEQQR